MKTNVQMIGLWCAMLGAWSGAATAAPVYESAEAAKDALIAAAEKGEPAGLLAVLGAGASNVVMSGDPVGDRSAIEAFAARAKETNGLAFSEDKSEAVIEVGLNAWPLPIPLVKGEAGWSFDVETGEMEVLARRIGRNELSALAVCRAYVRAQRAYQTLDRDEDMVLEFAQKIVSSPGERDGLYWPVEEGAVELSPMGPLIAEAREQGYEDKGEPYRGYYFRVLTKQGDVAPGGAYDYVINGNMVAGFGLVAFPADYGNSGVMTFLVGPNGRVVEKDLGEETAKTAGEMAAYDPDGSWSEPDFGE